MQITLRSNLKILDYLYRGDSPWQSTIFGIVTGCYEEGF